MLQGWCSGDVNSDCEIAMNESSVTACLLKLAKKMSEDEQLTLLRELVERLLKGSRKHERELFFMVVDYSTEDRIYKDYIKDISADGIFIETRMPSLLDRSSHCPFRSPTTRNISRLPASSSESPCKGLA
jgi:hypothetical protein